MPDIIFAVPRTHYDSYRDLYALIDLSGFPTCHIDEIDFASDNLYLVTILNGEIPPAGWGERRARIVLLDLEWHVDGVPDIFDEVWVGDQWYAERIGARYVPLGSCPDLKPGVPADGGEHYDVAMLGYMIPRRDQMRHDLRQLGVTLSTNGAWDEERHRILVNSSVYGHVHQHDAVPTIAPLRMVVAAAYALPFVTESVADAGVFERCIMQAPYHYYAGWTRDWLRGEMSMLHEHGRSLYELLCIERTFRRSIEGAA